MLKPSNLNLLSGLVIAIILLGAISAVTVFVNAQTYRDLALNFQRQYMTQLVSAETADIIAEQALTARRMRLNIQKDSRFRAAFDARDIDVLETVLDQQYHRAPVTSGLLDAVEVYVFDIDFNLLARVARDPLQHRAAGVICPDLQRRASTRTGAGRLKPLDSVCLHDDSL